MLESQFRPLRVLELLRGAKVYEFEWPGVPKPGAFGRRHG